jgi:tRNA pseudouridine38-40 synthase
MATFKLTMAYDGAEFSGWQAQPGQRTAQGELERAWREITGEVVRVNAAGRTDAGVHALGQAISLESATLISPQALVGALNSKLPEDAAVLTVELAADGFHATHDAKCKRYRYSIYNHPRRPVFLRKYSWHVPTPLNVEAMQAGAQALIGTHDFVSFQSAGSERESTVRTIFAVEVRRRGAGQGGAGDGEAETTFKAASSFHEHDAVVTIDVEGDGFLYNMVRAIAGTLAEVGRGRRSPESVAEIIAARDRRAAGQTAPAHGLTLLWVRY